MAYLGRSLGDLLLVAGIVPPNTRAVTFEITVDGPLILRYEILVDGPMLSGLAAALQTLAGPTENSDAD